MTHSIKTTQRVVADLIPDHIPIFGYMDDFVVLGFALSYYTKFFPGLFRKEA